MRRFPVGIRLLIAAGLLVIGYLAVARSLAVVRAKTDPISAQGVFGGDARINGQAALIDIERAKSTVARQAAASLARASLARDATVVPAYVAIALGLGLSNDDAAGGKWFAYSEKLSRRDFRTQLYFIERSVAAGDIEGALRHYDTALRANDEAATILYPILMNAISDAAVRPQLGRMLASKPLWAPSFLSYVAVSGTDYPAVSELFLDLRRKRYGVPAGTEAALVNNMVGHDRIADAWRYYAVLHPDPAKSLIRNGDFKAAGADDLPFEWQLTASEGVTASLVPGGQNAVLDYHLYPTVSSVVARQITFVPSGRYRLESAVVQTSQDIGAGPYWDFKCADGRPIGTLEMGRPQSTGQRFSVDMTIPENCGSQSLSLFVRASDDVQGATGQIEMVSLSKVGS